MSTTEVDREIATAPPNIQKNKQLPKSISKSPLAKEGFKAPPPCPVIPIRGRPKQHTPKLSHSGAWNTKQEVIRAHRSGDPYSPKDRSFCYALHRFRIEKAKACVDTTRHAACRKFSNDTHKTWIYRCYSNLCRIEKENKILTDRITKIMENGQKVDCWLTTKRPFVNLSCLSRRNQMLRVTFDNLNLVERIRKVKPMYSRQHQLEDYKIAEQKMEYQSVFPLYWKKPIAMSWDIHKEKALRNAEMNSRPVVFMDLYEECTLLGKIVIELRADVVPLTAENFRCLCTGELGMSYKCSKMSRILPNLLYQAGDLVPKPGKRKQNSIYGDSFPDESFKLKHNAPGIVTMVNHGKDTNGCQFIITARKMASLDGVNVVVGKIVSGLSLLNKLNAKANSSGRPKKDIFIGKCGEVNMDDYEDEETGADDDNEIKDSDPPQNTLKTSQEEEGEEED